MRQSIFSVIILFLWFVPSWSNTLALGIDCSESPAWETIVFEETLPPHLSVLTFDQPKFELLGVSTNGVFKGVDDGIVYFSDPLETYAFSIELVDEEQWSRKPDQIKFSLEIYDRTKFCNNKPTLQIHTSTDKARLSDINVDYFGLGGWKFNAEEKIIFLEALEKKFPVFSNIFTSPFSHWRKLAGSDMSVNYHTEKFEYQYSCDYCSVDKFLSELESVHKFVIEEELYLVKENEQWMSKTFTDAKILTDKYDNDDNSQFVLDLTNEGHHFRFCTPHVYRMREDENYRWIFC